MDPFPTTRWTMVLSAARDGGEGGREALAQLCEIYWYPLYAFVRRRVGADEALDLTQGFFADLQGRGALGRVDRDAGKFRAFLLASLKNYLSRERERAGAQRRGGGAIHISLDARLAEKAWLEEPADERTPERLFERAWALTVLDRVSDRLRDEYERAGKGDQHRALAGFLTDPEGGPAYAQVAVTLASTEAAVKMIVRRMRQRFGALLRDEIAQTVASPREIDQEIRHLFGAVREG